MDQRGPTVANHMEVTKIRQRATGWGGNPSCVWLGHIVLGCMRSKLRPTDIFNSVCSFRVSPVKKQRRERTASPVMNPFTTNPHSKDFILLRPRRALHGVAEEPRPSVYPAAFAVGDVTR